MLRGLTSPTKRKLSAPDIGDSSGSSKRSVSFNTKVEWHKDITYAIKAGRWETLRGHLSLQQSIASAPDASSSSFDSEEKTSFWKRLNLSPNSPKSAPKDRTGLLVVDSDGRTPLHVALTSRRTPTDVLVLMIQLEPRAAAVQNHRQRYPLHFAVVHRHHMDVIAELVDTYPAALAATDSKGMSPLAYALDGARRETNLAEAPRTFWMPAIDNTLEAQWQEMQGERWGIVHWLLLSSATHPQTSLSVGGKKPMLVDALIHAAPPAVISLLIGASVMLLSHANRATAFAGSTLYSCIARHYPLTILMSLVSQCPRDVHKVRDETGMGLLSSQYISGCFEQMQMTQEWTINRDFYDTLLETMEDEALPENNAPFLDWWQKMEFLIAYCAGQNPLTKPLLLHASLRNVDTPPVIVRLLLSLYPETIPLADQTGDFPLYLAAGRPEYVPRNYEPLTDSTILDIVLSYDKRAISRRHEKNQRLPIHAAAGSGRPFREFRSLVSSAAILLERDPLTNFYPVLQAACVKPDSFRWACVARNQFSYSFWKDMSDRQKASAILEVSEKDALETLTTVYELLRWQPNVLEKLADQTHDKISHHYLEFCYTKDLQPHIPHWRQVQAALHTPSTEWRVALESEFKAWWNKMKFWVRYCCPEGIPAYDDDYLLHAALANPNTPPVVIQLLLAHDPAAVMRPLPDEPRSLPLHLAAVGVKYTHNHWEVEGPSAVEAVYAAYPNAASMTNGKGYWPWYLAINSGKTGPSLMCLVEKAHRFKGLWPFQWKAVARPYSAAEYAQFQAVAAHRFGSASPKQVRTIQKEQQLVVLTTVFELLRARPGLVNGFEESGGNDHLSRASSISSGSIILDDSTQDAKDDVVAVVSEHDDAENDDDSSISGPSALSRLLSASAHANPPKLHGALEKDTEEDMFECDASFLSGVDVLSTLSSTIHTYDKKGGSQHRLVRMGSYQQRVAEETSSSDDEFAEEESICLEDTTERSMSIAEFAEESQNMEQSIDPSEGKPKDADMRGEYSEAYSSATSYEFYDEDDEVITFLLRRQPLIKTKTQRDPLSNVKLSKAPQSSTSTGAPSQPIKSTLGSEAHKLLQSSTHSTVRFQKTSSAHSSKKSTHSSTNGSYESLKPEERNRMQEKKGMVWVDKQVYKKTLLGAESTSEEQDLMDSFVFGSEGSSDPSSSHESFANASLANASMNSLLTFKSESRPAVKSIPETGALDIGGLSQHLGTQNRKMVPGIAAYLSSSSSALVVDETTESSNAPSTLSYLQDSSSVSTSAREGSSASAVSTDKVSADAPAGSQDKSRFSSDDNKNVHLFSTGAQDNRDVAGVQASDLNQKLSCSDTNDAAGPSSGIDSSRASAAATTDREKEMLPKVSPESVSIASKSQAPVSMEWERHPETKPSFDRINNEKSDTSNFYFDKKAMRWRTRSTPEETTRPPSPSKETKSMSNGQAAANGPKRTAVDAHYATPFVDILTRDDIKRRNRRFSNATNTDPRKTPSDREFRSTWRQMFDATEKSLCCLLCDENGREVLMVPCRHLAICRKCSAKQINVSSCPLCHKPSTDRMLLF